MADSRSSVCTVPSGLSRNHSEVRPPGRLHGVCDAPVDQATRPKATEAIVDLARIQPLDVFEVLGIANLEVVDLGVEGGQQRDPVEYEFVHTVPEARPASGRHPITVALVPTRTAWPDCRADCRGRPSFA
jgi:hypothetical protein